MTDENPDLDDGFERVQDLWRCDECGRSFTHKWPVKYPVNGRKCPHCKSDGAMPVGY